MADVSTQNATSTPTRSNRPNRGNYRGRGRGRGNARGGTTRNEQPQPHNHPPLGGAARAFGGQLTRQEPPQLDVNASPFVPASVSPTSSSPAKKTGLQNKQPPVAHSSQPRRTRRASRSTAPDIATRIHEDIARGIYECAICTNEISRNSKVWSCHDCWTVFHIGCIKKWSKNEGSAVQQRNPHQDGTEIPPLKQWRCPGCNLAKDDLPSNYNCWCEKELDPKVMGGLPPHSCGQTCARERHFPKACPHPCDQICHAGPCPPCTSIGPKQSCFCGKQETTRRCIDTEYEAGWSCGAVCGDVMPCGEHTCPRPCHEGLCGACEIRVDARCYCGKVEQSIMCSEQDVEKESYAWIGVFDCRQTCDRAMDCGIHRCEKICHPQDEAIPHCPQSPDVVTQCPCGKTALADLNVQDRKVCTDPIPSCDKSCDKLLGCGHTCTQNCHTGECPPCFVKIPLTCRCGRNKFETTCFGGITEQPQCFRTCKATLNCGRHECGERCCTGERKAAERQATRRKLKPLGLTARQVDEAFEAEHICTRVCGRPLKCGNHTCAELCHKGPCGSCREAIFDDISCNCGRTTLQAPLPCGTRPPPCNFTCRRRKHCGHPQVSHNCHTNEEECPKCPFLTEKGCLCGKKTLKNQPCWRTDVLCGLVCGKLLKCGSHTCQKTCHKPGDCEDAHTHCQQECSKPKKSCGHPCEQPCHAPSACKEDKLCPFKVMITCDCQRKKEEVRCNARAGTSVPSSRQTSLKCDEECARLERNKTLRAALHISDDHTDEHVPYSTETLTMYLEHVGWAHKQEELLRLFAADDSERRYRFPPMKSYQRSFMHHIAEDFGFDCESLDPEPHRHIVLFKTPKFVAAPMKTLAQAARIRRAQLIIQAPTHTAAPEKRADEANKHDYNGFLLHNPRFALTEDEIRPVLKTAIPSADFDIRFLSSTDAVALILSTSTEDVRERMTLLRNIAQTLSSTTSQAKLATSTTIASFSAPTADSEPSILHNADITSVVGSVAPGGWSQVAQRRGAAPRAPVTEPMGQKSMYTVLGSRLAEAKKKKAEEEEMKRKRKELEKEEVVEDWSVEVDGDSDVDNIIKDEATTDGSVKKGVEDKHDDVD